MEYGICQNLNLKGWTKKGICENLQSETYSK